MVALHCVELCVDNQGRPGSICRVLPEIRWIEASVQEGADKRLEQGKEVLGAASRLTVWLLSCEGLDDENGQTDLDQTAFLGIYGSEEKALAAERRAQRPHLQTYVDAYVVNELNWETEFTVE